ncbi:DUF2382 domain-containing protein [Deinococcus cavernae]|uniref:DUF2382 domain-containing protein n=1 Tax=Deinococcus cavernae TaxID=2320857 RepID=A0A418V6F6_9DEIO|nr:YsnF/AvaK domain-containing protein [Deinococcus cavernae]RJF71681.1 DUF2382 domain-containing protein [Deinococcus cavernae]
MTSQEDPRLSADVPGERVVSGKDDQAEGRVTAVRRGNITEVINSDSLSQARTSTELDTLTLHEERARVEVLREQAGSVSIRKVIRQREEVLPVTLTTETLEITVRDGAGKVTLNGEVLEPGRTYEVIVHDEKAVVQKEVFALSDVTLNKETRTYTHTENITLLREELDVRDPQGLVREVKLDD